MAVRGEEVLKFCLFLLLSDALEDTVVIKWLAKILGPLTNPAKDAYKEELKVPRKSRTAAATSERSTSADSWNLSPIDPVALARLIPSVPSPANDQAARSLNFDWAMSSASLPGLSNIESELSLPVMNVRRILLLLPFAEILLLPGQLELRSSHHVCVRMMSAFGDKELGEPFVRNLDLLEAKYAYDLKSAEAGALDPKICRLHGVICGPFIIGSPSSAGPFWHC
ncbi:hypothetical protein K438DRAFT_1763413 [Mycena galopus ATCC 62051]|nr:hypothetical protein K438DRAFT_1763413 [Mycena galopus ATCC 62051]